MILVKPLILSVLLVGILGVAEVASTKRGKGRRFQQRPLAPAYQNNPITVAQPQIPSYRSLPSGYAAPQALQQSPARPVAPRPGLVVFGVGPNSLQIPSHYSSYAGAPQQTKPIVPTPAYASPAPANAFPAPAYASPAPAYSSPAPAYSSPEPAYASPAPAYVSPAPAYASPAPAYASPAPAYASPAPDYASPAPAYASPAPVYSSPAPAYASPAPVYSSPAPAYASPAPAYASPAPAYASPTTVATQTPSRNQPAIPNYAQPAHKQQKVEQTKYNSQPLQPAYLAPSSQYGNKLPEVRPENYQQPSAQVAAVPAPVPVPKLPENVPFYVAPAKSTVYGSAYVGNSASYPASDSYTKGEASKSVEPVPASYQSTAKKPQENYGTTATKSNNSKSTAIYTKTKAEQSTEVYGKKTTQVKESQSYYSTPSPKVKYSTVLPYSTTESKPASDSYDKPYDTEKSKADKDQYKKPVYPASQSYKETETLSYGEKKKDIDSSSLPYSKEEAKPVSKPSEQNEYKESKQEDGKVKVTAYPKAESHKTGEYQKEKKEEVSVYSPILSTTKSETTNEDKSYQSHKQTEKSYASKDKPQNPTYSTSQSYKEVDSISYGEQKKKVDESSLSYSKVESKPVIESSKQSYQSAAEDKVKVSTYSSSQDYKEVDSAKDIQHYKKQESAVYEQKPVSDSYTKHSVSYVEESQPPKPVSTSTSYNKVESVLNSEYKQKHNEAEYGSSKAAAGTTYEKQSSTSAVTQEPSKYHESNTKTYESKYPSVSPATKSPVKEVNTYSKPTSDESNRYNLPVYSTTASSPSYQYSTGYTTTTKSPAISYEDKPKAYYTTTPKYQEYSTSAKVVTEKPPAHKSAVAYENTPVATTSTQKEDYDDQYSSKKNTNIKAGAAVAVEKSYATPTTTANYNVKANDRVYVVSDRDEIVETYQKKEPVSSYQSYPNPSVDEKLSSVKQVVNQYGPSDRGYNSTSSGTANKSSYEGRPASSSAADLPAYNRKPIKEADTLTISVEGAKDSGKYSHDGVEGDYSAIPGKPEIDYPIFSELPNNKFNCSEQRLPGYYADTSARCQVFHICLGDRQWSFLCPNGTIFSQQHFVCVWWYEFDCSKAPALYELNEKLFVIPSTQQALAYEGEQRTKALANETSEGTGKGYDTFSNKKEITSGAY